jgi:hypothetical protein
VILLNPIPPSVHLADGLMMSQTQWKVALATPAEIEVNRPWLDQQAIGLGTARPGPP